MTTHETSADVTGPARPRGPRALTDTPINARLALDRFDFTGAQSMWKTREDLDRYEQIIGETDPHVIIETGTHKGHSAVWFAEQLTRHGALRLVISVDIDPGRREVGDGREYHQVNTRFGPSGTAVIRWVTGGSADPDVVRNVRTSLSPGDRIMVVLDSAHDADHVTREIEAYGPLVTPGCHLVVEDTIFHWASVDEWARFGFGDPAAGCPLDALERSGIATDPRWVRDVAVEGMSPIGHHPAGFWMRAEVSA